jgi:hypothetical protein
MNDENQQIEEYDELLSLRSRIEAALAVLDAGEHTCGFDRNGSHSAGEYVEYDCLACKTAAILRGERDA